MEQIKEILATYEPISLDEMSGIKLMNRIDTKFVTNTLMLKRLLRLACSQYRAQEIQGERLARYYTMYFDTQDYQMYRMHQNGHTNRQKLRIRSYVDSGLDFLEVKTKNNRGRTKKKRMAFQGFNPLEPDHDIRFNHSDFATDYDDFLAERLHVTAPLRATIENRFQRITLVNRDKTERLTIDTGLQLHNLCTGSTLNLPELVIIELKRDGLTKSPILALLRQLRIKPSGFSKYCMGLAMTDWSLKRNRFKTRIHRINRIISI